MEIPSFYDICDHYDAFIFDLWGTIHDGIHPLPGALHALTYLKKQEKEICFLSNAPRRKERVVDRLNQVGVDPNLYDIVMSSGEDAFLHLKDQISEKVQKIYYMDYIQGFELCEGLQNYESVDDIKEADLIVNSSIPHELYAQDQCQPLLDEAAKHHLPMICVNPDKIVIHGRKEITCPGVLAEIYEQMGQKVFYHGKPHPAIYERCFDLLKCKDKSKILALGDAFHTDIQGAINQNIDAALLATGIHAKDFKLDWEKMTIDPRCVESSLLEITHHPTYILASLLR